MQNLTISESVNGPLLATVVSIEMVFSLSTNLFILLFTLSHIKILKQPSNIFLTNFILANLFVATFYMSTSAVSAAAGEWVFGKTSHQKFVACQIVGLVNLFSIYLTTFTLAVVSVDRFLLIVKPLFYERFMTTWVAALVSVCSWLSSIIMSPMVFIFGQFSFNEYITTCVPFLTKNEVNYIFVLAVVFVCIGIVFVTTLWTFIYTKRAIRPFKKSSIISIDIVKENVYKKRLKKVVGLFAALLVLIGITYVPVYFYLFVDVVLQLQLPHELFIATITLYFLSTILNPIIQSYFRRDLNEFIMSQCKKIHRLCCGKGSRSTACTMSNTLERTQTSESWSTYLESWSTKSDTNVTEV